MNKELALDNDRANAILTDVKTCLHPNSREEALLESPGVFLAMSKLMAATPELDMLALNVFRLGAHLAFKQAEVGRIINHVGGRDEKGALQKLWCRLKKLGRGIPE